MGWRAQENREQAEQEQGRDMRGNASRSQLAGLLIALAIVGLIGWRLLAERDLWPF